MREVSAMRYDTGGRILFVRRIIPLVICGVNTVAQTDVCLVKEKRSPVLLMMQENKRLEYSNDPEPVIAEAIAAFQENNKARSDLGLDPLNNMLIPCITMVDTFPDSTWYLSAANSTQTW